MQLNLSQKVTQYLTNEYVIDSVDTTSIKKC